MKKSKRVSEVSTVVRHMASRRFCVTQYANKPRSDMKGYAQAFEVAEDGELCGYWYEHDYGDVDVPIIVREEVVIADSPMEALYKFHRWLSFGLPDEYLRGEPCA